SRTGRADQRHPAAVDAARGVRNAGGDRALARAALARSRAARRNVRRRGAASHRDRVRNPARLPDPPHGGVQPRADHERGLPAQHPGLRSHDRQPYPQYQGQACGRQMRQCHRDRARRGLQARPLRAAGMTSHRADQKWRPSLGFVIFTVLALVAVLPLMGLFFFRLYDNQLIHQTQAELIAQSRVLAAIYARDVQARLDNGIPLGAAVPPETLPDPGDQVTPIRPALDLAGNDLLRRRPDALPAPKPADPGYVEIGARLMPIILETQKVTLAGFRILDPQGVVIAGRQEVGQSLAHIEEVAAALQGQYSAALRIRVPDKPPPPIYSISRGVG
ncbi:hypothetical protein chiPu_0028579, partial [Chiloscyllium punctatum]|nr:hypothetical protein [Chiloscyllium punctatum]